MKSKLFRTSVVLILSLVACKKESSLLDKNNDGLFQNLSDYGVYQGNVSDLQPSPDFHLYELTTPLFTDYSEKQRLIKVPGSQKLVATDDGLLEFPEGSILVKTFYYFKDKRDPAAGKKILETRILLKRNSEWIAGTYVWNPEQTDAILFNSGLNEMVNWIDDDGQAHVISYRVPDKKACITCHQDGSSILPLGPKVRNLNVLVSRNNNSVNQLKYFENSGILNAINPPDFSTLPDWSDPSESIEKRARAYLEMNCAHCHNKNGFAQDSHLFMSYDLSVNESGIGKKSSDITAAMKSGKMPLIGTTIIDKEGLALIKSYLEKIK